MPRRWDREQTVARRYLDNMRASTRFGLAGIAGDLLLANKYSEGIRDRFRILVIYPSDFLQALTSEGFSDGAQTHPAVYLISHHDVWEQTIDGHILSDWSLCLYVKGEVDIDFRHFNSLERLLEVVKTFLILERIYQRRLARQRATGEKALWPGPQRSHGLDGYLEAIAERGRLGDDELCICGSGLPFSRCHKEPLREFRDQRQEAA